MAGVASADLPEQAYPGERLGLPPDGRGSLASWWSRIAALLVDWAACSLVAVGFLGRDDDWRSLLTLAVFFAESAVLTAVAGGSFGQLVCRIAVLRLDRAPLGLARAVLRAALVCLALPPLVIGVDRRGLHDLAVGTVVINRR